MKNNHLVEIILFSTYSLTSTHQKELVRWLGTTAQAPIMSQYQKTKKLILRTLKDTPPIYMS